MHVPTSKDEVASHQDVNAGHCTALQDVNELQDVNADVNDVQDAAGRERERSGEPFPCSARCVPVVRCLRKALGLWPPSEMAVWPGLLSGGTLGAGVGRDLMC